MTDHILTDHLATIRGWVGRSFEDIKCWDLVREAYRLRGVELPDYYTSLEQNFRTVFEPEPWDVVPICNHRLAIGNHAGLYLGNGAFIHSQEVVGVTIANLYDDIPGAPRRQFDDGFRRERLLDRVARTREDRRHGFLRLRA